MQEKKSKLKAFAAALTGAAEEKAAAMNAETRAAGARGARGICSGPGLRGRRRASALADAKVKENKRIVAEGLAAKRSLLQFRGGLRGRRLCRGQAEDTRAAPKARSTPKRSKTSSGAPSTPSPAREAKVWLRRARTWATPRASTRPARREARIPGGRLLARRARARGVRSAAGVIDLSFDSALRGPGGRFSELTGSVWRKQMENKTEYYIHGVNGPVIKVPRRQEPARMSLVYVGKQRLFGEVVSSAGEESIVQIYEDSGGLAAGEPVYPTNEPMSIRLGPGLIGGIFDGIGRPLQIIEAMAGSFIAKGINIESLDETKNGPVTMLVKEGTTLSPASSSPPAARAR